MALLTAGEIIEIATRLEENGEAFYNAAAEEATTPSVKSLFEELAVQEQYHRQAFQQMGRDIPELTLSADQWEQFQAYSGALLQQNLFAKPEGALSEAPVAQDENAALQAALGFEKETLAFFHRLRDAVGGRGRTTVDRIIEEEERHIQRLSAMLTAG